MDSFLIYLLLFFLGSSIASFLMCGRVDGRSKCDGCGRKLEWHELMPVYSWLVQFGKTKCCNTKLSWKYLFGEIILGLWFVGCYLWFGWSADLLSNTVIILSLVLGSIFFTLVMEDLDDMSVSSRYLYLFCALAVLGPLFKGAGENTPGDFIPILIFSPFWLIYFLGKHLDKPMIGEADPYVFTALGIFFGPQFSISLFLYSVWLGAFLGMGYLYFVREQSEHLSFRVNKKFERNIRIPFLPIIFLACLIILVFNYHVIRIQDILVVHELIFKN